MNYTTKRIQNDLLELEKVISSADIYGFDIKLRSKSKETEWIILNDSQVLELIETFKNRLK